MNTTTATTYAMFLNGVMVREMKPVKEADRAALERIAEGWNADTIRRNCRNVDARCLYSVAPLTLAA